MLRDGKNLFILGLGLLVMTLSMARATTFLQFQSTYLGTGWFQYQMTVYSDPFFTDANVGIGVAFTNQIDEKTDSTTWTNNLRDSSFSQWSFTGANPPRPYSETFLMRSSAPSYRLGTNFDGATATMSLLLSEFNPMSGGGVFSENIVGFAVMPCLVPCLPDQADNSPTNYTFVLKLLPDVAIDNLIQTNGDMYGVDFKWDYQSTFVLQGSTDFKNWTNISYLWSWPPETVWSTNQPLNHFGNFFRVEMVANDHSTNLPPLNAATAPTRKVVAKGGPAPVRVVSCGLSGGSVAVNVSCQPGQTVQVQALDSHLSVKQSQTVVAKGTTTVATFEPSSLPSPVYFQAMLVP